jgi:adenylate cyclase
MPGRGSGSSWGGIRGGRFVRAAGVGLGLGIIGSALCLAPGVLDLDESLGLGTLFAVRGATAAPPEVAVVSISLDSAAGVGQTNELDEWPRELHARLIDRLVAAGATAIAFDVLFEERRPGDGDGKLESALRSARNVLLFEQVADEPSPVGVRERRVLPLPELKAAALGSAPFILPKVPIRVGQFWTFGRAAADWPSLPVVAAQAYLLDSYEGFVAAIDRAQPGLAAAWPRTRDDIVAAGKLEAVVETLREAFASDSGLAGRVRGEIERLPAAAARPLRVLLNMYAGEGSRYLNFYGPPRTVHTVPYDEVVAGTRGTDLAGKMVFVGFSETRQPDQQDDFFSVFSQHSGVNLSGVEVGATAFANLVEMRSLQPLPIAWHLLFVLSVGLLFGFLLWPLRSSAALLGTLLFAAAYAAFAYWQFVAHDVWWPLFVPLLVQLPLGAVLAVWRNYRELVEQRQLVIGALGYYVPPAVATRLAQQSLALEESRLLHGTCLVTDAEQYTTLGERIGPEALARVMNDYYAVLFRVVEQHGGEISDTAGDSMIAVWATAAPDAAVRARALRAAVDIVAGVEAFNVQHPSTPLPTRIGLEAGELVIGNIGAAQRYEYRAIGDIVNTAARIQGLNALLGTRVLVSATTLEGKAVLPARDVGTFLLRGKRLPVRVYEPLVTARASLDEDAIRVFAEALAAFRSGNWADAHKRFAEIAARYADAPAHYYAELAARYEREPPAAWTGAVSIATK